MCCSSLKNCKNAIGGLAVGFGLLLVILGCVYLIQGLNEPSTTRLHMGISFLCAGFVISVLGVVLIILTLNQKPVHVGPVTVNRTEIQMVPVEQWNASYLSEPLPSTSTQPPQNMGQRLPQPLPTTSALPPPNMGQRIPDTPPPGYRSPSTAGRTMKKPPPPSTASSLYTTGYAKQQPRKPPAPPSTIIEENQNDLYNAYIN